MTCLGGVDVAVLAGGMGTRIHSVLGDTPKALAPINGKPYLDHLLDWFDGFGVRKVVLCLGHLSEPILTHVEDRPEIICAVEPEPLGTGGAIKFARDHLSSDDVLIINGDTWLETDLCQFYASHKKQGCATSILCLRVDDVSRYGSVQIDDEKITMFLEKDPSETGPGLISAGAYLFSQQALDQLQAIDGGSLEQDFLQTRPPGTIHGFIASAANFIDIGTPESLSQASAVMPGRS
ncbi:MAG: NTP transferase domain-containing protein [Rhodospirillales bacterium]|nr:NTP transferase domain-containing protein [Rhodospirillales bacterium]